LRRGEPEEAGQVPLALRDVLVAPPLAGLHDADAVALLRGAESGDAPAESRADDHHVVVEGRHWTAPFAGHLATTFAIPATGVASADPGVPPGVDPGHWSPGTRSPGC